MHNPAPANRRRDPCDPIGVVSPDIFGDLKKYLSSTPILVAPKPQEPLLLYLAATNQVVSAALVAQREVDAEVVATTELTDGEVGRLTESDAVGGETAQPNEVVQKKKMMQHPVYFVSSLLQGARSRYSGMHKLLFGLLMCRMLGSGRPLRFELWGAHEDLSPTDLRPIVS